MKDMLVDMHIVAYHHLMARANYDIDAHSYLEITQYLQNLRLIKESFNKGNAQSKQHGNKEPKAHEAHKNHKKHGKNHTAGSIQMVTIPGLTALRILRVRITGATRIIGVTRMPPITTIPATIRTTPRKQRHGS
jgi:hypothetical protein